MSDHASLDVNAAILRDTLHGNPLAIAALDALVAEREKWEALFFAAEITRDRAVAERDEAQAEAERWKRATAEEKGLREGEEDRADHLRYLLDTTTGPKKLEAAEAERDAWKVEALHHNAEEIRLREALEAEQRDKGFALAEVERLGVLLSETEGERVGWKDRAEAAEAEVARLREAADAAMHELGVPQDHLTPAPVGNAYEILRAALSAPDTKEKGA